MISRRDLWLASACSDQQRNKVYFFRTKPGKSSVSPFVCRVNAWFHRLGTLRCGFQSQPVVFAATEARRLRFIFDCKFHMLQLCKTRKDVAAECRHDTRPSVQQQRSSVASFRPIQSTLSEDHISVARECYPPQIFARASIWPRVANPHPTGDGGPPTIFNKHNLKIDPKFNVWVQ